MQKTRRRRFAGHGIDALKQVGLACFARQLRCCRMPMRHKQRVDLLA
jgi:hypothetical protein